MSSNLLTLLKQHLQEMKAIDAVKQGELKQLEAKIDQRFEEHRRLESLIDRYDRDLPKEDE